MQIEHRGDGRDLAEWLQEAARRDAAAKPAAAPASARPAAPQPATRASGVVLNRQVIGLGCTAAAYLQYYFIGVMTEIQSMQTLVFFLPVLPLG